MSRQGPKAYQDLAQILEDIGDSPPPKPGSHWRDAPPPQFPTPWAQSWGQDEFGLWCGFYIADVETRLRWIPPGRFMMGSPKDESERFSNEKYHQRDMTEGFWLGETACSQALWEAVLKETPSYFKGADLPVEQVSWYDITERFLPALYQRLPALPARLPSEAEWEYACRARTVGPFWWGAKLSTGASEEASARCALPCPSADWSTAGTR